MALKTNYPKPTPQRAPKGPLAKDQLAEEHDTTSGETYGTTEGVKPPGTVFEQIEVVEGNIPPPGSIDTTPPDPEGGVDALSTKRKTRRARP